MTTYNCMDPTNLQKTLSTMADNLMKARMKIVRVNESVEG